jgi:tetratricopeptide (TPR) repeat protein
MAIVKSLLCHNSLSRLEGKLDFAAPMKHLEKLPKLLTGGGSKTLKIAEKYYVDGDYENCLARLLEAPTPKDAALLSLQGLCHDKLEQFAEAIDYFRQALMQDTENPEYLYNIARLYSHQQQPDIALGYLQFLESLSTDQAYDTDALYLKASVYEDMGQLDESLHIVQDLVEHQPEIIYKRYLAELHMALQDYDNAVLILAELVKEDADDLESISLLSKTLGKLGRWDEVKTHCKHWLELSPNDPDAFNQMGLAHYASDDFASAIAYYEQALFQAPESTLVLNNLGYTYLKQELYDKALETFTTFLSLLTQDSPEWGEVQEQIQFIHAKLEA